MGLKNIAGEMWVYYYTSAYLSGITGVMLYLYNICRTVIKELLGSGQTVRYMSEYIVAISSVSPFGVQS